MHHLHQITPENVRWHSSALSSFFCDRIGLQRLSADTPTLRPYMERSGGVLLVAYHALIPLACLSMKKHGENTAIIDGLYFSFESDAAMAANLMDESILLAKKMGYECVHVKKRLLPAMDTALLGFEPSANPRNLQCNLQSKPLVSAG